MDQKIEAARRESFQAQDSNDGGAPGAVKRPWSKPTVSLMHRIVTVHTGTDRTIWLVAEGVSYFGQS